MALPAAADFTGSTITEAQFKTAITAMRDYLANLETMAPGAVVFFPRTTAPAGWLKANGAAISRTTYASLFAAIGVTFGSGNGSTTFNLPDLRGEFLRGLDDSRGVDIGRTLSPAVQADQNKSHAHTASSASGGDHTHTLKLLTGGSANVTALRTSTDESDGTSLASGHIGNAGAHTHAVSVAANGGAEARVRNIALLACIKY